MRGAPAFRTGTPQRPAALTTSITASVPPGPSRVAAIEVARRDVRGRLADVLEAEAALREAVHRLADLVAEVEG